MSIWKILTIVVLLGGVVDKYLSIAPRWVDATPTPGCEVRNRYDGGDWMRVKTTATWSGACVDGKAEGGGVLEWFRNGELELRYEGELRAGRMTGHGAATTSQGHRFDGEWKDGALDGQAVAAYADGRRYEGKWRVGVRSGEGVLIGPGGVRYEGGFRDGHMSGHGTVTTPEGRFEGDWHDGKPNGSGVMEEAGVARYEGAWRDGKPNGQGTMTRADGESFSGLWKKGCFKDGGRTAQIIATPKECGFE